MVVKPDDPHSGGSKGTTRDCFELIYKASKYGAKVALFGRKINLSEDPIGLVQLMRKVVERDTKPATVSLPGVCGFLAVAVVIIGPPAVDRTPLPS